MELPFRRQQALEQTFSVINQIRDPAQRSWVFLNPTSIGDTMVVCAFAKAFREKHGGPLTMVVSDKQIPITQMYTHRIDRVITMSMTDLQTISVKAVDSQVFCMDQPYVVHPYWHGDGRWENFFELFRYPRRGGLSFCDIFRHILHLGWDASLEPPVIPEAWRTEALDLAAAHGFVIGKSVIFFPDNNSNPIFPDRMWELLANEFIKNGRKVFTNMAGNNRGPRLAPIRNTAGITIPVHLAMPLVEIAGRYVSGNNGLAVTLDMAKVRSEGTLLIYNKPFQLNSYYAKDPVTLQSSRYHGFSEILTPEYLVSPDDYDALIPDIAANNLKTALVW